MNIYIDTNIFLSFYHLTSEDLEELKKLVTLIRQKEAQLLLPEQTRDEFYRNRANKIAGAIKKLKEQKLSLQFPSMCKDYKTYGELRRLQTEYDKHHAELLEALLKDINTAKLKADTLTHELFQLAKPIETTDEIVCRARLRRDVGNPPGKNGSLGDAIIWEAILATTITKDDLYFVSSDKDYRSSLGDICFNDFLMREWSKAKKSKIHFYKLLSTFFKDKFPDVKLAVEMEIEALIAKLASSGSFAKTHVIIDELAKIGEFTTAQANDIVQATISNNQVLMITGDPDVNEFFSDFLAQHEAEIDADKLAALKPHLRED